MPRLQPGDRIAYAAKFLKDTGQFTGAAPQRRGTYLGPDVAPGFARVRWDDIETLIADGRGQYADSEYVAHVRKEGSTVHANNIAKVGSGRFALNDI